ncbi:MAG: exonuclease subunit SbcD [Chitinophagaceae bacterium]|nr:MAG: exonuclease subunit SbcD [Chitinophagaceae bacterium]
MKILHTADWHLGQLFHEYDRSWEHQQFLDWLTQTIGDKQIDVLLISGDVFDLSNPSAATVRMFYTFLNKATKANPGLQVLITAGNHDSPSRLESPLPLLESTNIHIVGMVEKNPDGSIHYDKMIFPLKSSNGDVKAWCLAVPFLRMGDYPVIPDCDNPYAEGVRELYNQVFTHALAYKQPGQAIIAMGHLHTQKAEVTDMDKSERMIMGGVECIAASAFPSDLQYVALGHIHKAQRIGGKEHIRYCGSPLPMSFSEYNYKHQVIVFDLENERIGHLSTVEVPVSVPLLRVPTVHSKLAEVLELLDQLSTASESGQAVAPYLEVRVLADGPEPALRHKIESVLEGKNVKLAKIDLRYAEANISEVAAEPIKPDRLHEMKPLDVFTRVYQSRYNAPVPEDILQLFNQITQEADQAH